MSVRMAYQCGLPYVAAAVWASGIRGRSRVRSWMQYPTAFSC